MMSPGGPALAEVRREFPGWVIAAAPRPEGGCVAIRLCPDSDPVPPQYAVIEADSPAELAQRLRETERAITRERGEAAWLEALEARYEAARAEADAAEAAWREQHHSKQ